MTKRPIQVSNDLSPDYTASQASKAVGTRLHELHATLQQLGSTDPRTSDVADVLKMNDIAAEIEALRNEHSKLQFLLEIEARAQHYQQTDWPCQSTTIGARNRPPYYKQLNINGRHLVHMLLYGPTPWIKKMIAIINIAKWYQRRNAAS